MKNILKIAQETKIILQKDCPVDQINNMILEFAKIKPVRSFPDRIYFQRETSFEKYKHIPEQKLFYRIKWTKWRVCKITSDNDMKDRIIGALIVKEPIRLPDNRIQYYMQLALWFGMHKITLAKSWDENLGLPKDKFPSIRWEDDKDHLIPVFPVVHHDLYKLYEDATKVEPHQLLTKSDAELVTSVLPIH